MPKTRKAAASATATIRTPVRTGTEATASQPLEVADIGAQGVQDAPAKARPKKATTAKQAGPKAAKCVKKAKATELSKATARKASKSASDGKGASIMALISRSQGATLPELMEAVSWQKHSVRGFISTTSKKPGVKIESFLNEKGERVYRRK